MSDFWKYNQQSRSAVRAFHLLHVFESKGFLTLSEIKTHNIDRGFITRLDAYYTGAECCLLDGIFFENLIPQMLKFNFLETPGSLKDY